MITLGKSKISITTIMSEFLGHIDELSCSNNNTKIDSSCWNGRFLICQIYKIAVVQHGQSCRRVQNRDELHYQSADGCRILQKGQRSG